MPEPTDPFAHLVISRKRKRYKFAHFDNFANCFWLDDSSASQTKRAIKRYFTKAQPLTLELAAGTADLSLELARRYPQQNLAAIDTKSDRLYTSAKQALTEGLTNLVFVRLHISQLARLWPPGSVETIWLTFPDPYPRKRSVRRRLTHPQFLAVYQQVLRPGGQLHFKTDNQALFAWSLEQFASVGWQVRQQSSDLHASALPADDKIMTAYERRFHGQGLPIYYVSISPPV